MAGNGDPKRDRTRFLAGGEPARPQVTTPAGAVAETGVLTGLEPGMILATETEAHLLVERLGKGGTASAFLAVPLKTAASCGGRFDAIPGTWDRAPGIIPTGINPDSPILTTYSRTMPVNVLKVIDVPPGDPAYRSIVQRMALEAHCYGTIHDHRIPRLGPGGFTLRPVPTIALEYFPGDTFRDALDAYHARRPVLRMHWQRAATLLRELCAATHVLHNAGVVHRDLKPENVVIARPEGGSEFPRLLDLGAAKYLEQPGIEHVIGDVMPSRRHITRYAGLAPVTPGYGAPEQYGLGGEITPATDVYALGAIAYECLAGRLPYDGATYEQILVAMGRPLPRFDHPELSRETCDALHFVIAKALAQRPGERFQSALGFAQALRGALEQAMARRPASARPGNGGRLTPLPPGNGRRVTPLYASTQRTTGQVPQRTPWWAWAIPIVLATIAGAFLLGRYLNAA